jgi:hypothetical protein
MKLDKESLMSKKNELQIRLKPYIVHRYEPLINNGTVFIYNKKTGKILTGDCLVYDILRTIECKDLTIKSSLEEILKKDNSLDVEEIVEFLIELNDKDIVMISEIGSNSKQKR